jgi:hypothetical protein
MKNKIYTLGLVLTLVVFLGVLFKMLHWPVAGVLLTLGIFLLVFIFLPLALISNFKASENKGNRFLYIVTWITCLIVFTAMLFKIMHWPGAGYALLVSLPFPFVIYLPVFIAVTSKNKNFNIYNMVAVLFLLVLISAISGLLSLNVSKERIIDSLKISANYTRLEMALDEIPVNPGQSLLERKTDEALILAEKYKALILRHEGITKEQWESNPAILLELRSLKSTSSPLVTDREDQVHDELKTALSDLIELLGKDNRFAPFNAQIKEIIGMDDSQDENYIWTDAFFRGDVQPWVHAYLDGLIKNLKILRLQV